MNKQLFSLLLATSSTTMLCSDPFDHMHAMIESMREMSDHMEQSFQRMRTRDTDRQWQISFDESDDKVSIHIKGLTSDFIDATVDEDKELLRVKTDEGTIFLHAAGKLVQITARQERKKESDDKNIKQSSYSVSQSSMAHTVGSEVDLEHAEIDYVKENKELSLALNKRKRKEKVKTLPVHIK